MSVQMRVDPCQTWRGTLVVSLVQMRKTRTAGEARRMVTLVSSGMIHNSRSTLMVGCRMTDWRVVSGMSCWRVCGNPSLMSWMRIRNRHRTMRCSHVGRNGDTDRGLRSYTEVVAYSRIR